MIRAVISRIPIKITVPLLLTVPVLIVVVVLSTLAFIHGRSTASLLASENLAEIHDRINNRVDVLLSIPGRINHINEGLIRQGKLDVENLRGWRETLFAEAVAFETLSAITWGSENGESTWVCRYSGVDHLTFAVKDKRTGAQMHEYRLDKSGRIVGGPSGTFEFDPRIRPWYKAPMKAGKAAWSEPFVWVGEDPSNPPTVGIAYGQPFRNAEGLIIGVIDADISLHDISQFLESLKIGKTGMAFVIDRQGLLIANSRRSPVADRDTNRLAGSASSDKHIAAATNHLLDAFPSCAAITETYQSSVLVDGRRHMLMVSPFEHETGLSWLIATMVPESDFLAEVEAKRRQSVVIGLVVVCLTVILGIGLAVMMVRPFLSLVSQLRVIGGGDLEKEVHLDQTPEFTQVSSEINKMVSGLRDRMNLRHSLALAMEVQQNLLPSTSPTVAGLDISGHSTYCDETGGDYYDFLDVVGLSKTTAAIAIGDVTGHGIAAAMLMATARGILLSHCDETGSLAELLTHMNNQLVKDVASSRFMTMLLMTIDAKRGEMRWASAGHDPPFVYDSPSDQFVEIDGGGVPLGILDGGVYEEYLLGDVKSGQVYLVSTDGVWETINEAGDMFGKDRVRDIIRQHAHMSAAEIGKRLRTELVRFGGKLGSTDDVTFVVVKIL